jgi:hypothetical protein
VGLVLFAVSFGLIVLDQVLFHVGLTGSYGELLYSYVDVTRESNVPTFWNAALLLFISAAAVLVAYLTPGRAVGWWIAAALAFVMSLDETVQLHERLVGLGTWVQDALGFSIPTFSWLIPGALIALGGAALLWVWSGRQPRPTRLGLRLGVCLYGAGVIVVEAIGGKVYREQDISAGYRAITGLEELLEMTGAVVALIGVLAILVRADGADGSRSLRVLPQTVPHVT